MSLMIAASILVIAPVPQVEQLDAAHDLVAGGREAEAIDRIAHAPSEVRDHPAALINLGIAYARQGKIAEARGRFERAAETTDRYELETGEGRWVDSRKLARAALAALASGAFEREIRTAMR